MASPQPTNSRRIDNLRKGISDLRDEVKHYEKYAELYDAQQENNSPASENTKRRPAQPRTPFRPPTAHRRLDASTGSQQEQASQSDELTVDEIVQKRASAARRASLGVDLPSNWYQLEENVRQAVAEEANTLVTQVEDLMCGDPQPRSSRPLSAYPSRQAAQRPQSAHPSSHSPGPHPDSAFDHHTTTRPQSAHPNNSPAANLELSTRPQSAFPGRPQAAMGPAGRGTASGGRPQSAMTSLHPLSHAAPTAHTAHSRLRRPGSAVSTGSVLRRADTGVYSGGSNRARAANKSKPNRSRPKSAFPGTPEAAVLPGFGPDQPVLARPRPTTAPAKKAPGAAVEQRTLDSTTLVAHSSNAASQRSPPRIRPTSCNARKRPESAEVSEHQCLWRNGWKNNVKSRELTMKVFDKGDSTKEDVVFVRPYWGRLTDLDMQPLDKIKFHPEDPRDVQKKSKWEQDIEELRELGIEPELATPCTCCGCALKELRCLHSTSGKIYLTRRSQRLCVDKVALRGKLSRYNKQRLHLMGQWAAVAIQTMWRGYKQRKKFRVSHLAHQAAVCIQRVARVMLGKRYVRRVRYKKTLAALTIQRYYRGSVGRAFTKDKRKIMTAASQNLERVFRGFVGRKDFKRVFKNRTDAALRIQAGYTGLKARRYTDHKRTTMTAAAFRIQAGWSGRKDRVYVTKKRDVETAAARIIQRATRSWLARTFGIRLKRKRQMAILQLQMWQRGNQARRAMADKRYQRDTGAAIHMQRVARGMLGRRKWHSDNQAWRALKIQRVLRGCLGRKKAAAARDHKMLMLMKLKFRMKIHWRVVKKRSLAAAFIQRVYRGFLGRRRFMFFLQIHKSIVIQRWVRARWALFKIRSLAKKLVTCQSFIRMLKPRLRFIRRHNAMREHAQIRANQNMKELTKLLSIDEFFNDCNTHPHKERLAVANAMIEHKVVLRRLYLKYSMILVVSPEKAFQMSKSQFIRFIKDTGLLGKKIDNHMIDEIFGLCNMDVEDGKTVTTGTKYDPANPQNVMMPDEFAESVIRLCDKILRPEGVKPMTSRINQMFETVFSPLAYKDFDITPPETPGLGEDDSETNDCIEKNYKRIEKCFRHFAGANDTGLAGDDASIDCVEWMMACKECLIIDANTSFSKVLEIFVRCNQEEIEDYLYGMPDPEGIRDMCLEIDEFLQAVVATANLQPAKKKTDPYVKKLEVFLEKLLMNGTKQFV